MQAEQLKPEEARKIKREAANILTKMVDIPSEFQQDAIVLRRLMGDKKDTAIANYTEAIASWNASSLPCTPMIRTCLSTRSRGWRATTAPVL